jgi:hypothetical protein
VAIPPPLGQGGQQLEHYNGQRRTKGSRGSLQAAAQAGAYGAKALGFK